MNSNRKLVISVGSFHVSLNARDAMTLFSILEDAVQLEQKYTSSGYQFVFADKQSPVTVQRVPYALPGGYDYSKNPCCDLDFGGEYYDEPRTNCGE